MRSLNDYIKYIQQFYKLIDKCSLLDQIKSSVNHISKKERYNEIELSISVFALYDTDTTDFCENPLQLIKELEEVVFSALDVLYQTETVESSARFYIKVRFTDVPPVDNMILSDTTHMVTRNNRIVTFSGLVVSLTVGSKFSRSCSFSCADKFCRNKSRHIISIFYPEYSDSIIDEKPVKCKCGMDYLENINERKLEECVVFSVLLTRNKRIKGSYVNRAVPCIARGNISEMVQIGKRLYFIGYLMARGSLEDLKYLVEVNNVLTPDSSVSSVEHLSWMKIWQLVPPNISRFEFGPSFMMAFMFADEITIPGSFFLLKLLLMLLLLSNTNEHQLCYDKNRYLYEEDDARYRPISVVVVARDTNLVSKIINTASYYTQYFYQHGNQDLLVGKVSSRDNNLSMEFGSLLGPENHIVYLPNLLLLPSKELSQLRKVLQNRLVQPESKAGLPIHQKSLLCKVWACIDLTQSRSDFMEKLPITMRSLIESFDLFCLVEDPEYSIWENVISENLLDNCMKRVTCDGDESHQLYHSFLQNAARINVTKWSHGAEVLLRGYYMIGRKYTRESSSIFPQSALSVLLQLATNLAKLNNRSMISSCDSILAIFLYEYIYSSKCGVRLIQLHTNLNNKLCHVRFLNDSFLEEFDNILHDIHTKLKKSIQTELDPMFLEE